MIVSCGEALVDLVPDPVPGGGPMNVAIAAARLGAPSAFVGRVSTDRYGQMIWDHLQANDVDLRACERGSEPTARAIVEHRPHLVFRFEGDNTADMNLEIADLSRLDIGPHIVHGGTLGLFRGRTADTLATLVEGHRGIVSLDPNIRPQIIDDRSRWEHYHQRWVANAHIYKSSDEDFDWIWPNRALASCAEQLLDGAARVVFATHGADGVTVYWRGGELKVAGRSVEVVDTVGAGDTFAAMVLVALRERGLAASADTMGELGLAEWQSIAERAVAAAAITCSRAGADPPRAIELSQPE